MKYFAVMAHQKRYFQIMEKIFCLNWFVRFDKLNTSPYHPMTDGLVERFNSFISQSLSMYISANQKDWDEFLPSILFAYHTSLQATTGDSPFYLLYGREPRLPLDVN